MSGVSQHIEAVARYLLGDPNQALSTRQELRYGTHGSLAIDLDKGTWFDHQNQAGGGVLALIDRELKGANGTAVDWLKHELGIELAGDTKQQVATYPYTDEQGNVLFEVVRLEPKNFRQRRPDGRGGWIWNLRDVKRVLFHLPPLLSANDRTIHIVEGEKDVLALERLGLVATTNSGGAGKWRREFAAYFRGADVVILPDNDEAGNNHAEDVAKSLQSVASRLRIVHLPGLPPKGDVCDWIKAGGTVKTLAQLCPSEEVGLPDVVKVQNPPATTAVHCLQLADWLSREIPQVDRLMGHLFTTTTRALLVAATGLGKTNFAMAVAISMVAGRDFLHWQVVRPARVLFIDGEMSRRLMKVRLADAARRLGDIPANFFVLCRDDVPDMPPLNTPEGQAYIDRVIEQLGGIDFVIFDNVMSLTTGDMKDEESWQQTLPWIKDLTRRSVGQLWVHHAGHDQTRSYGTSTREWQLDTVALLKKVERHGSDIAFGLEFTKARERTPHNRADFEPVTITLSADQWAAETSNGSTTTATAAKKLSPAGLAFHGALVGAVVALGQARSDSFNQPAITMDQWRDECARRGLIDRDGPDNRKRALISKYRSELGVQSQSVMHWI